MSKSEVWKHFMKAKNDEEAQCMHRPKKLACKGSNTSGLLRHLKRIHSINEEGESTSTNIKRSKLSNPSTSNTSSIIKFLKRPNLNETVARLACEDGIPFKTITKSSFIRNSMENLNFNLPKN